MNLESFVGLWGYCEEDMPDRVHPDDRASYLDSPSLASRFCECIGVDGDWITLRLNARPVRIRPRDFRPITGKPEYRAGDVVQVKKHPDRHYRVIAIGWHHKRDTALYCLAENGKNNYKRYYLPDELAPSEGDTAQAPVTLP